MTNADFEDLAERIRRGEMSPGIQEVKRSLVRVAVRSGDDFLKVFLKRSRTSRHEERALRRAAALGISVPAVRGAGEHWVATEYLEGARAATREDLDAILEAVELMHRAGALHRDLHIGNLVVVGARVVILDLQRMIFLPGLPRRLRERELGFLAYSLGEPIPEQLRHVGEATERRAHQHWRSRTKRCLKNSSVFTSFEHAGKTGFRRRDIDEEELNRALDLGADGDVLKLGRAGDLYRCGNFMLKKHTSRKEAKRAWVAGHGLEVRGIPTGRALAWSGRWLVMRDDGDTLIDWIKPEFEKSGDAERSEMAGALSTLLARLHRRGIYHADLKANNILWSPGRVPRLIDYGRVRFGRRIHPRHRVKNLAQINAALPDYVPASLREVAFGDYLEQSGFSGDAEALRREVIAVSLSRNHRWHGC